MQCILCLFERENVRDQSLQVEDATTQALDGRGPSVAVTVDES
jgi:hypothetical protein